MKNNQDYQGKIYAYFAKEEVPDALHHRLEETCRRLEERPQEVKMPTARRRYWWKGFGVAFATVTAAFVLLCGVNAVNPVFAESIPLIGKAFRLYNGDKKTMVGTYVGTYDGVAEVNAQATPESTQGLSLVLNESYSDGEYVHLTFTMEGASQQVLEDLYYVAGKVNATANGQELDETYLLLYPEGDTLLGALSLPLKDNVSDGETLNLSYQVSEISRCFNNGGDHEELPGAFQGQVSVTVDTSHNKTLNQFENNGDIQINWVEATPSYTKINYTIPFWGISTMPVNFPQLYLTDGTNIQMNMELSDLVLHKDVSEDTETITATACFDSLPSSTEEVVLRFFEEQIDQPQPGEAPMFYPPSGKEYEVRVLAESTIDLDTGEARSSQTYLDAGMHYADDYRQRFEILQWFMYINDPDMAQLGQTAWKNVIAIPELFQNGNSLWSFQYNKVQGQFQLHFVTDGPAPEKDLSVAITDQDGNNLAQGSLSAASAEETSAGGDAYYEWETTLDASEVKDLQLMDFVTVTLTDPDSGETVYQRTIRLIWRDWEQLQ